jgi:hypothetical protein
MQIQTILRFHLTPVRIAVSKSTTTNIGMDMGEKETSFCWRERKLVQSLWKTVQRLLKKQTNKKKPKNRITIRSSNTTPRDIIKGR